MLINPFDLENDLNRLEEVEKASLRFVTQAILNFCVDAKEIFQTERDLVADIGEDITREALDRLGMAKIDQRLFGKTDYKRARYLFHPDYVIQQALFIDSKAEKISGQNTATLQLSQFSLTVNQIRAGKVITRAGNLPKILQIGNQMFITTSLFVKYNYEEVDDVHNLRSITIAALPNGMLQEKYNPNATDSIWLAGRNAESRGEEFRVRLHFRSLKQKANWRVQYLPIPPINYQWED